MVVCRFAQSLKFVELLFSGLVHSVSDVRQREIHTAEPLVLGHSPSGDDTFFRNFGSHSTWCYVPEGGNSRNYRCENLKSYIKNLAFVCPATTARRRS
jgi:hypothetical protein